MKNKLLPLLVIVLALCFCALTACDKTSGGSDSNGGPTATYELEGSLPEAAVFGEELDLSSLFIVKRLGEETERIPVTKDMITSGGTASVGVSAVTFSYDGNTFTRSINVKYRVTFVYDGETLDVQYVTDVTELTPPNMPSDSKEAFLGWLPAIDQPLTDNTTYSAVYEYVIPSLPESYSLEYGSLLSDISLPSGAAGKWVFNAPLDSDLGDAGQSNPFEVSFVLHEDGSVIKTDTVTVNVVKKRVEFLDIVTEFTYNGDIQLPTFNFGNLDVPKSSVIFLEDGESDYTSAGEHYYTFIIDSSNFEGEISGTYTIVKPTVTVNVESYTITIVESIPEIGYTVQGFDEDRLDVLGLSVKKITVTKTGEYVIDVECKNSNVDLIVNKGKLTVTVATVDINEVGYPVLNRGNEVIDFSKETNRVRGVSATYEDTFEDYTFAYNPYGVWKWERTGTLGSASSEPYSYNAVFYHNNSLYEPLVFGISVTVAKKTLHFHFSDTVVDYNGLEQGIKYEIYENADPADKGKRYDGLTVLGYKTYVNVNVENGSVAPYIYELTLSDTNYEAYGFASFTVNRIDPLGIDFSYSFDEIWSGSLTLSGIKLPSGYSWVSPLTSPEISEDGIEYEAVYTPEDTVNYNTLRGFFTVRVRRASATVNGVKELYEAVYNGEKYTLSGIVPGHNESTLSIVFMKNGEKAEPIGAGEYDIVITLPKSEHYGEVSLTSKLVIKKATNTDTVLLNQSAIYGDPISALKLPGENWSWLTDSVSVGNAGVNVFEAKFTDPDGNYEDREVKITVTVSKKSVNAPSVESKEYDGLPYVPEIPESPLYTVIENEGGTNKGRYSVTLKLTDSENYAWISADGDTVTLYYEIAAAINKWTAAPTVSESWFFGETPAIDAVAEYGDVRIEYSVFGENEFTEVRPTAVGKYTVRFTTTDTNYTVLSETFNFTIKQAEISIPTPNKSTFVYNGQVQAPTLEENDAYTVTYTSGSDVGLYSVTVALKDTVNYVWADGTGAEIVYNYEITKAHAEITGFTVKSWTYGTPTLPVASSNFGTVVFTYYGSDGAKLSDAPKTAGAYTVVASVVGTDNYSGAETAPVAFTVTPASATISGYSEVENAKYQNLVSLNTGTLSATYMGAAVKGSFSYSEITFSESTSEAHKASYVDLTFTPEDSINYSTVTVRIYMALKTVAKLNNEIAYGSIENALNAASSGNTVWVTPDVSGNVIIKENVTIKTGVTLIITFGTDDSSRNIPASDGKIYATITNDDNPSEDPNYADGLTLLNKKSSVRLAAGVLLTNNGTIEISGELGAPGGGVNYTGHTVRNYAELVMEANSSIVMNQNSAIVCCGFIYESSLNNGSSIAIGNGAYLAQPYTIRDYRGGSYFKAIYDILDEGYTAFNMFQLKNVTPTVRVNRGGEVRALVNFYASDTMTAETVTLVGSESNAVIQLNTSESYLIAKLDPTTEVNKLDIYGGAVTNGFQLNVKIIISFSLNTEIAYFPVSYFYDITLNGNGAKYYMNQDFKFLTGSKLTVEEGATLYAKKLIFYETFTDPCTIPGTYPAGLPAAEFILRGTAVIEQFGGIITADSDTARFVISKAPTATAYEVETISGSSILASLGSSLKITLTAKLKNASDGKILEIGSSALGRYFYDGNEWKASILSYNSDGGNEFASVHLQGDVYPTLPTPLKSGYIFLGWFFGDTQVRSGDALLSTAAHTLTAVWKEGVTVNLDKNGGSCIEDVNVPTEKDGAYYYAALPSPTKTGHTFLGWFYGDTEVKSGDAIAVNGEHTVTTKWQINSYTIKIGTLSEASISGVTDGQSVIYGTAVTVTVTYNKSDNKSYKVTDADGNTIASGNEASFTFTMPASDVTITAESKDNCVTPDTLITLADGTQVRVDSLTGDELLLVWNMETGTLDYAPIMFIDSDAAANYEIIKLCFSDGTVVKVISEHGFWDYDLNKYVYLDKNGADYIGHTFAKQSGDKLEKVTLVSVVIETELTTAWSPVTVGHLCYFVNGMLSMPGGVGGLFNIFEVDPETMTYDYEKLEKDIETYGLYTYEELNAICPLTEEMFYAAGGAYLKISIGKGNMTLDELIEMINRYSVFV